MDDLKWNVLGFYCVMRTRGINKNSGRSINKSIYRRIKIDADDIFNYQICF